jgi:ABC-type glycerol-3-phosphate transport system permease component
MAIRLKIARRRIANYLLLIPMGLIAFSTIYPLFFTLNAALKTKRDFVMNRFALTLQPTLDSFTRAWTYSNIGANFLNSLIVTVGAVLLLSIVCSMAGYAFSKMRFRGSRVLFMAVLAGMMVPIQVILVPFYQQILTLHLLNTHVGLILSYTAFFLPFGVYLMTAYYTGVPSELGEAAKVDGASLWQIYLRIMLPLGRPALATLAILNSLYAWNDLLISLMVLQAPSLRTLMVGIAALRGQYNTDVPLMAAGLVLGAVPVLIMFLVFQGQITKGITLGAVKG